MNGISQHYERAALSGPFHSQKMACHAFSPPVGLMWDAKVGKSGVQRQSGDALCARWRAKKSDACMRYLNVEFPSSQLPQRRVISPVLLVPM